MKIIYKYSLIPDGGPGSAEIVQVNRQSTITSLNLPKNSKILWVASQKEKPTIWIEFDNEEKEFEVRWFASIVTGANVRDDSTYLGTCMFGEGNSYILHIYEIPVKRLT